MLASEFLLKYYRPLWVFRQAEVDACQEGNEFSYLQGSKLFEGYVFERIWKKFVGLGKTPIWNYWLFSSTFPQ